MKQLLYSLVVALGLSLMWACNSHKLIPDKELAMIFHDAMLVNAFITSDSRSHNTDSVNIYEPIFAKYGYTVDDFHYTMDNFSRRKSARLSDVAEVMLLLLDREAQELNTQVTKLDTIENVARRRFTRTLLEKENIEIKGDADTALMNFTLENIGMGDYTISGYYTLPKESKINNRRMLVRWYRPDSSFSQAVNTMVYVRDSINFIQKVKLDQPDMTRMFVSFNHFNNPKDRIKKPKMTIHSIRIEYTPTLEECVRRLFNEQSSMQIFADTMLHLSDSKPKLE